MSDGLPGTVRAGQSEWPVIMGAAPWENLDEASAVRIRDLKTKTVKVGCKVKKIRFVHESDAFNLYEKTALLVDVEEVTLDGFSPPSTSAKKEEGKKEERKKEPEKKDEGKKEPEKTGS